MHVLCRCNPAGEGCRSLIRPTMFQFSASLRASLQTGMAIRSLQYFAHGTQHRTGCGLPRWLRLLAMTKKLSELFDGMWNGCYTDVRKKKEDETTVILIFHSRTNCTSCRSIVPQCYPCHIQSKKACGRSPHLHAGPAAYLLPNLFPDAPVRHGCRPPEYRSGSWPASTRQMKIGTFPSLGRPRSFTSALLSTINKGVSHAAGS